MQKKSNRFARQKLFDHERTFEKRSSISHLEKLIAYIENQEEHHKTLSFQDEYRSLLRKNGIIVDETYLWD
jgi:hypothetical protein